MPVQLIKTGAKFSVYAWSNGGSCDILDFLAQLKSEHNYDAQRLAALMSDAANYGPVPFQDQCRSLQGKSAEGLFEFKAPRGGRIIWFYDKNRIIVCTHGFVKKRDKTPSREIQKAQKIRQQYLKEKHHD